MKKHRQYISEALASCNGAARILFGLLATERLRACCCVAEADSYAWSCFASILDDAFAVILDPQLSDSRLVDWIAQLEKNVPHGGEPLQVQGQSAILCLIGSLRLFDSNDSEASESVINAIVDALDNYTFYIQRFVARDTSSPENYALLQRELSRQLEDVNFVRTYNVLTLAKLIQRRMENFQFAVPVAVGI